MLPAISGIASSIAGRTASVAGFFSRERSVAGPITSRIVRDQAKAWKGIYGHASNAAKAATNGVYQLGWAIDGVKNIGRDWFPQGIFGASVRIWGDKYSDTGQLYFLAVAIANNTVANPFNTDQTTFWGAVFMATINPSAQFVEVHIVYSSGGLLGDNAATDSLAAIQKKPLQNYNAINQWPPFLRQKGVNANLLPGWAYGATPPMAYHTPENTVTKLTNPYPEADFISRSSDLVALVTAALIGPCDDVETPKTFNYNSNGFAQTPTEPSLSTATLGLPGGRSIEQ